MISVSAGPMPAATAQTETPRSPLVRIPFAGDDGSLTPYTFEVGYPLVTLIYDTLLWRDNQGIAQPWLARSMQVSSDGRRLTLKLVEGVRWHDGVPLTAADVAFTFAYVATHPHPRFTPELKAVERVEAGDATTVRITLRQPSPGFADQPLADLPILPAHLWKGLPPDRPAPEGLAIGSGPYRLVEHRPGQGYRFEANANYFRGRPAVDAIEVPIIDDAAKAVQGLERRAVDAIPVGFPEEVERFQALGTKVLSGPSYLGTVLMFNLRAPPFDRLEVRQAVSRALDLSRIGVAVGRAVPADRGYLHPASPWSPAQDLHVFDEGAAREQLARLGVGPIQVLAPDNDPVRFEAARQVALALQRVGVSAEPKGIGREELSRAVGQDGSPPSFQATIWNSAPLASFEPDFLQRVFASGGASLNYSGYQSPVFDKLAQRASSTTDLEARRSLVRDELQLLSVDLPVVPLFFSNEAYAYRPAIYDGWVFMKGTGILDKRSFVEPARVPGQAGAASSGPPSPGQPRGGQPRWPLAVIALAATGLVGMAAMAVVRRGRSS